MIDRDKKIIILKRCAVIAGFVAIIVATVLIYVIYGKQIIPFIKKPELFKAWLSQFNNWDQLVFVGIRTLQTVIKFIPAEPLEIGSGYAYGTWYGFFLCSVGTMLGTLIIFGLTKLLGKKFVQLFVPQSKIDSLQILQNKDKLLGVLFVIYFIPGTPKDFVTYFIGLTNVNIWWFLVVTSIARIPSIISSTICGANLAKQNYVLAIGVFTVFAILSLIGGFFYKKLKIDRSANESDNGKGNNKES